MWEAALAFAPAWLACDAGRVVVGGAGGVACLRQQDGVRLWDFSAAGAAAYYYRPAPGLSVALQGSRPEPLNAFRLAGGRVFFLAGGRRLFALDAQTGRVLWHRGAPGAGVGLPFPGGRFFPHYHAGDGRVLIQSAGRRWLLDAATGRVVRETAAPAEPWPRAPLPLGKETLCLVPDARRVVLLDTASGRERWTYTLPGVTTLSGEPPHVLGAGPALLVVTPTNLGYELGRLDRATGRALWERPVLLSMDAVDVRDWAVDGEAVYFARGDTLSARSLSDGRSLWEQPLAGRVGAWAVRRAGELLLAAPSRTPGLRFQFRWLGSRLQWEERLPPSEGRGLPLVCCDPRTGQLIQRLTFSPGLPRLRPQVRLDPDLTLLPRAWAEREAVCRPCPGVQVLGTGLVVAFGRRVWGLHMSAKR